MATQTTIHFTVTGDERLHCTGCEQRVGNAIRRLPGIRNVQASHTTQAVSVTINPDEVSAAQVQATLERIGYEVARQDAAARRETAS